MLDSKKMKWLLDDRSQISYCLFWNISAGIDVMKMMER